MKDTTITPATINDVPALVKLVNAAYRGDSSRQGWTTEADLLDGIRTDEATLTEMMQKEGALILKQLSNSILTGCVYLQKQENKVYLGMLTVDPTLQTQGIGKQLLKGSEEYARQQNCRAIEITVITIRTELINWYERHGYKKTGVKKPFPDDPRFGIPKQPLEFYVMEKLL